VKLCAPDREVFAMVGDGSWLMMPGEIVTAVQEGIKLVVVLVENGGYASIGGLSASLGSEGFGTRHAVRGADGQLSGRAFPIDFVANAQGLGVRAVRTRTIAELREALAAARRAPDSTVIVIATDREVPVPGYESWWDVPPAEVSSSPGVEAARKAYEQARRKKRWHL
jgi:3D-(3,5/4)-trihydroxycyclohexane-1,2-dione acylhydrolase (decyclizing)